MEIWDETWSCATNLDILRLLNGRRHWSFNDSSLLLYISYLTYSEIERN